MRSTYLVWHSSGGGFEVALRPSIGEQLEDQGLRMYMARSEGCHLSVVVRNISGGILS